MDEFDPINRLAMQRAIIDSADIEAQLIQETGARPVITMLIAARRLASDAIHKLVFVDPDDPKAIRDLQNEIRRYGDLVEFARAIIIDGKEADELMNADEREEIRAVLAGALHGDAYARAQGLDQEAGASDDA